MGVIKTNSGYEFFASDGAARYRQLWHGHWAGNDKSGSVVTAGAHSTILWIRQPAGRQCLPKSRCCSTTTTSYGYMVGGPVYQIPVAMRWAGNLLVTYHAELPNDALYAALGLVASSDNGLTGLSSAKSFA
jgi:hypothetical protein